MIIEMICMCFFTIEMIVRLFAYPSLFVFFSSYLNVIEFMSVVAYYVHLPFPDTYNLLPDSPAMLKLKYFGRAIRILSFLRLGSEMSSIQILSNTLKHCRKELATYFFYLFMGNFIYCSKHSF